MKAFEAPGNWLAGLDIDAAALLIAAAADIAVILDSAGVIADYAFQNEALASEFAGHESWRGKLWRDLVSIESRPKIDEMLAEAASKTQHAGRHVNFPAVHGPDMPTLFTVLPVGKLGQMIAFGRDLRAFATMQQRVVDAQQSFERDYAKMRHIETRYRILFQMIPEPVLIIDMSTQKIIEANPAARQIVGAKGKIIGHMLQQMVEPGEQLAVETMLADVRATGRAEDVILKIIGIAGEMNAAAFSFRQGPAQLALVRLTHKAEAVGHVHQLTDAKETMLRLVERVPDGFVVTDHDGLIIAANEAFLEMAQLPNEAQAIGENIERWIGRSGVDLNVLLNNLRHNGSVRLFSTIMRDEFAAESDVEISAGTVINGGEPCYGFAIRGISRRVVGQLAAPRAFPKSLEQIIELIGRVSLKDLVREATDVIERLSIEAALAMTGDNRASAAEVLGVSRQSLYVKMRRHGLLEAEALSLDQ